MSTVANRRSCPRFRVPGATLSYRDETCEVVSLSRGGLAFLRNDRLRAGQKLSVLLTFSLGHDPIQLHGQSIYCNQNPKEGNCYTIGISFAPFSKRPGHNSPESLRILRQLERAYTQQGAHSIHWTNPSIPAANS